MLYPFDQRVYVNNVILGEYLFLLLGGLESEELLVMQVTPV